MSHIREIQVVLALNSECNRGSRLHYCDQAIRSLEG